MSLRQTLSANLARLCEREGSRGAVCRAAGINRQQFAKYLSGGTMPSQRTLDKICRHFGVDEHELFRESNGAVVRSAVGEVPVSSHVALRTAWRLTGSERPTSVSPGIYFAYFVTPEEPSAIMRSTIVVRRDGHLTTFRRLTGIGERKGSWWSNFRGDHRGIVFERRHCVYFVALNSRDGREPTFLVLRWQPISRPIMGGQAIILTPSGPSITAVVMHPCQSTMTLRSALRASHIFDADDPAIEPTIADMLDKQRQALVATARQLDLSVQRLK